MASNIFASVFLSHLCGEEDRLEKYAKHFTFLSHLCGEEVAARHVERSDSFLSHLCGEEEYF